MAGIITKISVQKNNQDRYNIFIDQGKGEEYAFSVDQDVLIKFDLRKGKSVDELSLTEIQYHDEIRKSYNLGVHYLARRMRSEHEIKSYLSQKGVEGLIINEVIHKLNNHGYINDEEFAAAYVRTQMNTTDKGPEVIKLELKEKGIVLPIIERTIEQYPMELQIEKATVLTNKYIQKNQRDSFLVLKQKLEQMLVRKGYTFQVISIAISESELDKNDDEELKIIRLQGEKFRQKFSKYSGYEFQQKLKQALYRKGFSLEIIEKYITEIEDE